jgi:hypothetical protein
MANRKVSKRPKAKAILRLPDLEQSKNAVLHSLAAASSQESYGHAINEFITWYCSEPRLAFNCRSPLQVFSRTEEPRSLHYQRALSRREAARLRSFRYRPSEP